MSNDCSSTTIHLCRLLRGEAARRRKLRYVAPLIRAKLDIGCRSARMPGHPNRFAARILVFNPSSVRHISAHCARGMRRPVPRVPVGFRPCRACRLIARGIFRLVEREAVCRPFVMRRGASGATPAGRSRRH
jgi:hypothetical protein